MVPFSAKAVCIFNAGSCNFIGNAIYCNTSYSVIRYTSYIELSWLRSGLSFPLRTVRLHPQNVFWVFYFLKC